MYDPGGHVEVMRETLFQLLPKARKKSVVVREGYSAVDGVAVSIPKVTLDSGASHGSYVGKSYLIRCLLSNNFRVSIQLS